MNIQFSIYSFIHFVRGMNLNKFLTPLEEQRVCIGTGLHVSTND